MFSEELFNILFYEMDCSLFLSSSLLCPCPAPSDPVPTTQATADSGKPFPAHSGMLWAAETAVSLRLFRNGVGK